MINKIDINDFGIFQNYQWNSSIDKNINFRKINIIYGRNYSGKTTLSRIFRCLEEKFMHKDFAKCSFSIDCKEYIATPIKLDCPYRVRVYNTDFVRKNLGWLYNEDGSIQPFAILGEDNIEIEEKIEKINRIIGSEDNQSGLLENLKNKIEELNSEKEKLKNIEDYINNKLSYEANSVIKINTNLFLPTSKKRTYSILDIRNESSQILDNLSDYILSNLEIEQRTKTINENAKLEIESIKLGTTNFNSLAEKCNKLRSKKISLSEPITELLENSILEEWVRAGITIHEHNQGECKFCGNPISPTLWNTLAGHFSKETDIIRSEIRNLIDQLKKSKSDIHTLISIKKDQFYSSLYEHWETAHLSWTSSKDEYTLQIDIIINALESKLKDIYNPLASISTKDFSSEIINSVSLLNEVIDKHNRSTSTLAQTQDSARKDLRLNYIAQFLFEMQYASKLEDISQLTTAIENYGREVTDIRSQINSLLENKRQLESQLQDESKGAELINKYLRHFFGHDQLKLVSVTESNNSHFKIVRQNEDAKNLSEGESRLISFCYFIAKMDNEIKTSIESSKPIIYIDDSSLDSNHIFFVFSLIESIITSKKNYLQLFISTHNLDFLKYLKNLTIPRYKKEANSKTESPDIEFFLVSKKSNNSAVIELTPKYLREYVTEFNYLFQNLYTCAYQDPFLLPPEYIFNFGNNVRKFLEAYLFYKYPSHNLSFGKRLSKFFDGDTISYALVNRLVNEYSHIEQRLDRGMEPIEQPQAQTVAIKVLERIRILDEDQFLALLDSIGVTIPPKSSTSSPS